MLKYVKQHFIDFFERGTTMLPFKQFFNYYTLLMNNDPEFVEELQKAVEGF